MLAYEYQVEAEILELKAQVIVYGFALEIREARETVHRGRQL
jgi:hypothetical protein